MAKKICHPLQGVCALLNLVGHHLELRDWTTPGLCSDMLPDDVRIVYKSGVETAEEREDALPIVAYSVANIRMAPFCPQQYIPGAGDAIACDAEGAIKFRVSTTSEELTSELCTDLAGLIFTNHRDLQKNSMFVTLVDISPVQRDQAGYYIADVAVSANLNRPVWKKSQEQSILREIGIKSSVE